MLLGTGRTPVASAKFSRNFASRDLWNRRKLQAGRMISETISAVNTSPKSVHARTWLRTGCDQRRSRRRASIVARDEDRYTEVICFLE